MKKNIWNANPRPFNQTNSYNYSFYCPNNRKDICECTANQFNCFSNQINFTIRRDEDVHIECQSNEKYSHTQITSMSLGHPKTLIIENCSLQGETLVLSVAEFKPVKIYHVPLYYYKNGKNSIYDTMDAGEISLKYSPYFYLVQEISANTTLNDFMAKFVNILSGTDKSLCNQLMIDIQKFSSPYFNNQINVIKLQSNNLTLLEMKSFYKLLNVDVLYFVRNEMKELKPDVFQLSFKIKKIIFDGNDFSMLPVKLLKSNNLLTDFELHNSVNSIQDVPEAFFLNKTTLKNVLITNNGNDCTQCFSWNS